jgi:SAM-dependent methyltransferase
MIDRCRATLGETENQRFQVADARDLSCFAEKSFDFVLFCWNGIDAVSHADRLRILREVRRVLRAGGHFFFSTHTIYDFPFLEDPPPIDANALVRSTYRRARAKLRNVGLQWKYRKLDPAEISQQPYAILTPPDHDFGIEAYYIRPDCQPNQLRDAGFAIVTTYDQHGVVVDPMTTRHRGYLYFLCRPCGGSG